MIHEAVAVLEDVHRLVLRIADRPGVAGVSELARVVRVISSGELTKPVNLKGLIATKGAKAAIEAAGGSIA